MAVNIWKIGDGDVIFFTGAITADSATIAE